MSKPYLPLNVRKVLELRGVIKLPGAPAPRIPKVDELIVQAAKKGFGVEVVAPVPDPDAKRHEQPCQARVLDFAGQVWEAEDVFPAVAVASALADALVETEATQVRLFAQAAD